MIGKKVFQPQTSKRFFTPDVSSVLHRAVVNDVPTNEVPPIVNDVLNSPGQPLDPATQSYIGAGISCDLSKVPVHHEFDHSVKESDDLYEQQANQFADRISKGVPSAHQSALDLSRVRIHTDELAAQSAQHINARAYTAGANIVFGHGQYAPYDPSGRWLLAHEVAHVVQQQHNPATSRPFIQRVSIFQSIARFFGGGTFSNEELQNYLAYLRRTQQIEDHYDSDNKAREIVRRWKRGQGSYTILTVPIRTLLIKEMSSGYLSEDDQSAILDLLSDSIPSELVYILARINIDSLKTRFDGDYRKRLDVLLETQEVGVLDMANEWTPQGVMKILKRHGDQRIIRTIVDQSYKVFRFQTAFDKWRYDDGHIEEEELTGLLGNTRRDVKQIRLRKSLTNEQAATTLFHEVSHVLSTETDYLEQEIQVRVQTEEFLIRHGLPATQPEYRRPNATVNEPYIRSQIMASPHYNPTGRQRIARRYVGEAEVGGWVVP